MAVQPIDIQTNLGNITAGSKIAKQGQIGAEREQVVHGAALLEKKSKEIESKLLKAKMPDQVEQMEEEEEKDVEEQKRNARKNQSKDESESIELPNQSSSEKHSSSYRTHPHKGKFIDISG
jgi:hypothetical protein